MKGLSMQNSLEVNNEQFNYPLYAKFCKINPVQAQEYLAKFNQTPVVIDEEITTDTQKSGVEQSIADEENQADLNTKIDEEVAKSTETIVIRDEDVAELRKLYKERHPEGKNAFGGWDGQELVKRINQFTK